MRHRRTGRKLGRNPNHQRALLKSLATALFLTELPDEMYADKDPRPKKPGRIVTTLPKAKEVRPLVEKCITIARKAQKHLREAESLKTNAVKGTDQWRKWRNSDQWQQWNKAIAPAVAMRRHLIQLTGSKNAAMVLLDIIGPRFENRNGGYTRILKLATPRLGDAGARAILEFVGQNDRVKEKAVALPKNND